MISKACGRAWLSMFLLSFAHGADLSSTTRSLPQSCDAVRTVAVPWLKQHNIRPTGNAYRCGKNDDDDCIDFSGNRLRNTHGRRIWRLDRYYIHLEDRKCVCSRYDESNTSSSSYSDFGWYSVTGISGTLRLQPQGSGCIVGLKFLYPAKEGCCGVESGKVALFSNGRLESEYVTSIETALRRTCSNLPNQPNHR